MKILDLLKSKPGVLLLISIFLFLVVVMFVISLINNPTPSTNPQTAQNAPAPALGDYPNVISLEPSELDILPAGTNQNFTITFKSKVTLDQVSISLTKQNYTTKQNPTLVESKASLNENTTTLTISPTDSIQPFNKYILTITDKSNNTKLLSATYNSRDISPTIPVNNNPELKQFLPHETPSYKLSFNTYRGVYVFNFKINPNSTISLTTQYENAKREAEKFIRNKGIDLNSIVIEWRHS